MAEHVFGDLDRGRRAARARVLESGTVAAAVPGEHRLASRTFVGLEVLQHLGPWVLTGPPAPVERSSITVPISPTGRFADTVTYEDAVDPTRRFWLPRYRLRTTSDDHYEIGYELVDGVWLVRLAFETYPAEEIAAEAATASVLPHHLTMVVTSGSSVVRTYSVGGLESDERGWTLSLRLTLEERDALLRAFTSDDEHASVEVRREVTVAAPVAPAPRADDGPMVGPFVPGNHEVSVLLPVIDPHVLLGPIFVPIEHVEPPVGPVPVEPEPEPLVLGPQVDTAVPHVELLRVASPLADVQTMRLEASPELIAVQPRTRLRDVERMRGPRRDRAFDPFGERVGVVVATPFPAEPPPPPPPPQLFSTTTTTLAHPVPLRFDVATHPYLFPSGRAAEAAAEYLLVTLPWAGDGPGGRQHVYCQDLARPDLFLYLPDVFLVGTLAQPPHGPELVFSVGRDEADPTRSIAVMSAHVVPQTSLARLANAREQLASHVPIRSGVREQPHLEPMLVAAHGHLQLPGGTEVDDDDLDLVNGWWIAESFDYDALQEAYAVLSATDAASALLRGHVSVRADEQQVSIPLEVRLDRPATPALAWTPARGGPGTVTVALRNVGPDPVVVPSVSAWLGRGDEVVPATVADPGWPVTLAAGGGLDLTLLADQPPGADQDDPTGTLALDLTAARVVVTPESAVERTLDRLVARLPRVVRVMTVLDTLTHRDLSAVALEFEDADPVTIDPAHLSVDVLVPVPLVDLLLRRSAGTYRFRQTLFPRQGDPTSDEAWRSSDLGLLPVPRS